MSPSHFHVDASMPYAANDARHQNAAGPFRHDVEQPTLTVKSIPVNEYMAQTRDVVPMSEHMVELVYYYYQWPSIPSYSSMVSSTLPL